MDVASLVEALAGVDLPATVEAYDGSRAGPPDAPARIVVRSPTALRRLVASSPELALARAYAAGEIQIDGDIFAVVALQHLTKINLDRRTWAAAVHHAARGGLRPPGRLPGEARLHGRRHTPARDAAAIAFHYDLSTAFYKLVLGPSMTYSCAVWADPLVGLERAQEAKHELVCRKLGLQPGMRLLDVGCGWGTMVAHAARRHGVRATGITLSARQAEWASAEMARTGLADVVEIRHQDYRDVDDGPYDAICSIGMFEHVGLSRLRVYFERLHSLLRPGGRLLNHGISRPPYRRSRLARPGFMDRFVFPDGEPPEVGHVVSTMQEAGFEPRHLENLREHYALTLRAWVANLERSWDAAVAEAGLNRARIWRLYMAAAALNFEANRAQIHQVLAVRTDHGRSGLPLRPSFELTNESDQVSRENAGGIALAGRGAGT
jgi:cyclopropane-fatty-acyl-phospholipid synthase